ncbi:MAG: putative ral secretion pathway protein [Hyphomicrobiales bacterium]|nr:putative ral secretion pathway protein [Hyphomicrobiales bacterium]
MTRYRYEAFDATGNLVAGEVDALSTERAHEAVRARGVTPFAVKHAPEGSASFSLFSKEPSLSETELANWTRDLSVLLKAGLPLDRALKITGTSSPGRNASLVAERLMERVLRGDSLAAGMQSLPQVFREDYVRLVQAGEASATLGLALENLAGLLDAQLEFRKRLRSAIAYPAFLVAMTFGCIWIVMTLLVPAVTPVFVDNGMPLPTLLRVLDSLHNSGAEALTILLVLAAIVVCAWALARRNEGVRLWIDRQKLRLPVVGRLAQIRDAARFTSALATFLRSGVAPIAALQSSCRLVRNRHAGKLLSETVESVRHGASLGEAISMNEALPPVARQMIVVGEESGKLNEMLLRVALVLDRQEAVWTARILGVISPALTLLVAGLIASVLLSVMSAILSINDLAVLR